jgi:chitinase
MAALLLPACAGSADRSSGAAGTSGSSGTAGAAGTSGDSVGSAGSAQAGSAGSAATNFGGSSGAGTSGSGGAGGTSTGSSGSSGAGMGGSGGAAGNAGNGGAGGTSTAGGGGMAGSTPTGKTEYAPYYEIGATTGAFKSLVDLKSKAGVNDVTLAFVLAGNGCNTDNTIGGDLNDIKAFVAAGGHVKASFGGASGTYVEAHCGDAASLATAFSNFVDATGITDLDFDVEQAPVETTTVNTRRGQALRMVQDSKHVQVSFTLQTDQSGLDGGARSVVSGAVNAGVTISHVNLMVMDYGDMAAGTPIAPVAIGSLNGAVGQLKTLIQGLTSEQAWAMLGATPDIGQNDDNEIFTLKDAQDLTDFARQNKLGLISFWSIQRDQVCGHGECSQHDNANFDYSNIFKTVTQ